MTLRNDIEYWLILLHLPFLGYATFAKIFKKFSCLSTFFKLETKEYVQLGLHPETIQSLKNPPWKAINSDILWASRNPEHTILTMADANYPYLLRQIPYPPPVLFIHGNVTLLNTPQLAIVGSRSPTPTGIDIAYQMAKTLSQAGLMITSGLALGIDTAAHKGALKGSNNTIAVMGTGMDFCYPRSNKKLLDQILEKGVVISQFPYHTRPLPANFPRRNQIISGLSLGTLVVEASLKSGSLITAACALEQGREVFAVPSSIYNTMAKGCHSLLKQGAKLVESIQDIFEELPAFQNTPLFSTIATKNLQEKTLEVDHRKLLECIGYEPTYIDLLVKRSQLSIPKVTSILVDLELAGHICLMAGGYTRRG